MTDSTTPVCILSTRTTKTQYGELSTSIASNGKAQIILFEQGLQLHIFLSREQVLQLARNITDVVGVYDVKIIDDGISKDLL